MRGTELKQSVDGAVRQVRAEAMEAQARLLRQGDEVNHLVQTQARQAEELAQILLGEIDTLGGEDSLLFQLRHAMAQKDAEYDRLRREEKTLAERISACERALSQAQEDMAAADEVLNDMRTQAGAKALEDKEMAHAKAWADEALEKIENARNRLATAQQDAAEKSPHYLSDPFFSYLLDRGYGQKGYQAGRLTRALDGWVARLVRFDHYHADFQRLKEIPEKIAQHIQWLEDQRARVMTLWEAHISRILKEEIPGHTQALDRLRVAQVSEESLGREIQDLEEKIQIVGEGLARIAQGTDAQTRQAVFLVKEVVLRGEREKAGRLVQATPTAQDDALLASIRHLDEAISQAREKLDDAQRDRDQARDKLTQAEDFQRRFTQAGLGRSNRRHPSVRKGDVATAILTGQGLASVLRGIERQVRTISNTPSSSSGGRRGSSSSSSWPSSRSSSSGMGGFGGFGGRTGGGFGGGIGRTGGGF